LPIPIKNRDVALLHLSFAILLIYLLVIGLQNPDNHGFVKEQPLYSAVSYLKKKVLILPLLDALSPLTGGVGGGLTLRTT